MTTICDLPVFPNYTCLHGPRDMQVNETQCPLPTLLLLYTNTQYPSTLLLPINPLPASPIFYTGTLPPLPPPYAPFQYLLNFLPPLIPYGLPFPILYSIPHLYPSLFLPPPPPPLSNLVFLRSPPSCALPFILPTAPSRPCPLALFPPFLPSRLSLPAIS